jgi:hypothetical protein
LLDRLDVLARQSEATPRAGLPLRSADKPPQVPPLREANPAVPGKAAPAAIAPRPRGSRLEPPPPPLRDK